MVKSITFLNLLQRHIIIQNDGSIEIVSMHSCKLTQTYKIHTFCASQQHTTSACQTALQEHFGQKTPREN